MNNLLKSPPRTDLPVSGVLTVRLKLNTASLLQKMKCLGNALRAEAFGCIEVTKRSIEILIISARNVLKHFG